MSFEGWYVLDHENSDYYDGGTVEVSVNGGAPGSVNGTWINGPNRTLTSLYGNPNAGTLAFAGDSLGWVRSRVDLSGYGGSAIQPQFTMRSDSAVGSIGWYLDDISVYTCDPVIEPVRDPQVTGFVGGMTVSWPRPSVNPDAVATYTIVVQPCPVVMTVPGSITSVNIKIKPATCGSRYEVTVFPQDFSKRGPAVQIGSPYPRVVAWLGMSAMRLSRHGAYVTFNGSLATFERPLVGATVQLQRKTSLGWVTIRTLRTHRYGRFATTLRYRKRAYYRIAYAGGPGLVGKATKAYYG